MMMKIKRKSIVFNAKNNLSIILILIMMGMITMSSAQVNTFPYTESFESGWGDWVQSTEDDFNWTINSGSTGSSNTGPSSAYDGSYYIYTEASSPNYPSKTTGVYATFDFTSISPKIEFYYHMYGGSMGTLRLEVSIDGGITWNNEWELSGNQGNQWVLASVNLTAYEYLSNVMIRFWSITGSSYTSDASVDYIRVYESAPMNWVTCTSTQSPGNVFPGSADKRIIGIEIETTGALNPIEVTQFTVNANGTQNIGSNIENAKLFYTGTSNSFHPINQFGVQIINPTVSDFNIIGTQVIAEGTNYFWLTYDIKNNANIGDIVDAECTQIETSSKASYTPSITAPAGVMTISELNLADDLVAYYPFDDGTATDMTGNGHDGTINGSVPMTDWQNGKYITFNGDYNNFVEIPHHNDLNFSSSFSISVWIKKLGAGTVSAHVITKGRDISSTYTIAVGGRSFRFAEESGTIGSASVTDVEFPWNVWHYVTCVVNSENQTTSYYLNGELMDQNPITQSFIITTTYPLVFGRHFTVPSGGSSWPYPCHASIDEVRIYSKALSESEIQELYELNALATTWTGALSNAWNEAGNWDYGVPIAPVNAIIPTGLTNYPTLSASGECNNLTLQSDANGTATILDNGFLTVNGTTNVERYFSGNDLDWHLVSSPVSNATAGVFTGMYLQSFDESDYSWDEIINPGTFINVMEGYGLYSTLGANNTVTFTGNLNTGIQSATYNLGADSYNWNLLGNPFPSSIDWDAVSIPTGISNEVHYIDAASGNDLSYVQFIGGSGSRYIPPHQGFFVSATSSGNLTLDDSDRTHLGANNFYKSENPDLMILQASGENYMDETWIHFHENANEEHDGNYDAYKRISLSNPELPQIFSITPQNDYLSVNGLPETETMAIGFSAVNSGVFAISAKQLMESTSVILEDKLTNETTDLFNSYYTFNYTAGENPNRFILHFTPLAVGEINLENVKIYSFGQDVYVNIPVVTHSEITIYNISGQMVVTQPTNKSLNKLHLNKPGCYIVKVQSGQNLITKKVFVE